MSDSDLLARVLAGEATPAERETLLRQATTDPDLRRQLGQHAALQGLLGLALEPARAQADFSRRVTATLIPDQAAFTSQVIARVSPITFWPIVRPAVAAILLIGVTLGVVASTLPIPVGRISGSAAVRWTAAAPPTELVAGTRLALAAGLVEIELAGRGTLIIEGPAELELSDPLGAILHRGRIVMHATPAGHGYRVETPRGDLVDLGTRFAVSVAADGATEAHVLEGAIAAFDQGHRRTVLTVDQAAQLGPRGITPIAVDPDGFYTALPPPRTRGAPLLHWPLDDGTGLRARAVVDGHADSAADFALRNDEGGAPPQWIAGRFGQALAFDGAGAYAESPFPGIAGTGARTVACWVKVPRDFTRNDGFALVSWGNFTPAKEGSVWQVAINPIATDGPLGRLRVGTARGLIVGTTDLRDDAWHHVAVVMYGGDRPAIGTHVLVYVDGALEPLSRRTLHPIDTRISGANHGVWLGRNITHLTPRSPGVGHYLRGAIDEVVIVRGALDQEAILRLRAGRTP